MKSLYTDGFTLEVKVDINDNTFWLTQKEMARLFDVFIDNIGLHIKNILKDNELDKSTTEESSEVRIEGNRKVRRKVLIYNLDMIISVVIALSLKTASFLENGLQMVYFYNNVRIKTGLNNMSPLEFRKQTFAV